MSSQPPNPEPAPSASGTTAGSGVTIYWTVHHPDDGPGAPLLLINGLGSPLVAFEPGFVAALVAEGFSVARFDNRDVGRSDRLPARTGQGPPYTLSDMAADAVAVLDRLGWAAATVVGQSMGGMIAQQLAIEHPARVTSLVGLMTSSGERGHGRPTEEAMAALVEPAPREPEAWLEHRVSTERVWASPAEWSEAWVRAKGQAMIDHGVDPQGSMRQFRATMAAGSRDDALGRLTVPALVIHGSADTLIRPDGGRHLAEVIPGARYVEIDGLGHDLPPAYWGRLAGEISGFVTTHR